MFSGIVSELGEIIAVEPSDGGRRLTIAAEDTLDGMSPGRSVAVNGVCLTVTWRDGAAFSVEAVAETLARSNLGHLVKGDRVDLERPVSADGRFDGHITQGHVDGVGRVAGISREGNAVRMRVATPPDLLRYVVEKGSIAVDGVSLTVTAVDTESFEVVLIPHTLDVTVLGERRPGDLVNLEVDILAKYVERLMESGR